MKVMLCIKHFIFQLTHPIISIVELLKHIKIIKTSATYSMK